MRIKQTEMKLVRVLINLCGTLILKVKNNKTKVLLLSAIAAILIKLMMPGNKPVPLVQMSKFLCLIETGDVKAVLIKPNYIIFKDALSKVFKTDHSLMPKNTLFELVKNAKIEFSYSGGSGYAEFAILFMLTFVITLAFFYFSNKQDDNVQKRPQKEIMFKDIVGLEESKVALTEVIQYMRNPIKFLNIGARMRKGIILYGPPGTGKTTLAKACAGEAGVHFFACNASEFCEIYVGAGPKKVRELFKRAKQESPSIIFIDEIDAIGNRKGKNSFDSGADTERNTTINQLLSEMDGFGSDDSVLVIAATNKLELIDRSLLRPGRFDLKIAISLPKLQERQKIFRHHMSAKRHNLTQAFFYNVAEKMIAWSGADIENLANQSVYQALRRKSSCIEEDDIRSCLQNNNITGRY